MAQCSYCKKEVIDNFVFDTHLRVYYHSKCLKELSEALTKASNPQGKVLEIIANGKREAK